MENLENGGEKINQNERVDSDVSYRQTILNLYEHEIAENRELLKNFGTTENLCKLTQNGKQAFDERLKIEIRLHQLIARRDSFKNSLEAFTTDQAVNQQALAFQESAPVPQGCCTIDQAANEQALAFQEPAPSSRGCCTMS